MGGGDRGSGGCQLVLPATAESASCSHDLSPLPWPTRAHGSGPVFSPPHPPQHGEVLTLDYDWAMCHFWPADSEGGRDLSTPEPDPVPPHPCPLSICCTWYINIAHSQALGLCLRGFLGTSGTPGHCTGQDGKAQK